jgi:hypothetical protein
LWCPAGGRAGDGERAFEIPSLAATAVVAPASERRVQFRITLGAMSNSRLSSATVFSPVTPSVDDSPWGLPPHLTSPWCAVQSGSTPAKRTKIVKDFSMGFIHSQATKTRCYVSNVCGEAVAGHLRGSCSPRSERKGFNTA